MAKEYQVKIYDTDGSYITTWTDIVSEIKFANEINTGGSQLDITLARNAGDYGEGSDVDFGLKVVVYCIDKEMPTGDIVFQGYISSYTPIYKDNHVQIVVLSYGAELSDYMLDGVANETSMYVNSPGGGGSMAFGCTSPAGNEAVAIAIRPTTSGYLGSIMVPIWVFSGIENTDYADAIYELWSGTPASPTALLDTATKRVTATSMIQAISIYSSKYLTLGSAGVKFSSTVYLSNAVTYFIKIYPRLMRTAIEGNSMAILYGAEADANNALWTKATGSAFSSYAGIYDGWIHMAETTLQTTIPYLSVDPSDILRNAIDTYNTNGGLVTYTDQSIDDTSSVVSYTFRTNSILEVVAKCLELSPRDWYWYLDYGTNLVNFHEKSNSPDHIFSLESHIIDAKFEKRIDDIVNCVYFTGGDTGGGVNLYRKYLKQDSIDRYGLKAVKYSDQRVTLNATAETIANSILEAKSQPELRVTLQILDSNNNQGVGYDIESIKVGDVVAVRNITQQVGLSSWDVARWDDAYWDFNIYNLSSLQMQVRRIEYNNDTATIHASTMAVDINKRIEDINRNLEALQSANNPNAPT